MKKFLIFLLTFTLILPFSFSVFLKVEVHPSVNITLLGEKYGWNGKVLLYQVETYNSGSIGYRVRVRVDVIGNLSFYSMWTEEKELMPGDRKLFKLYWYPSSNGTFLLQPKIYFANQILSSNPKKITISNFSRGRSMFKVRGFRTYEGYVRFELIPEERVRKGVIINPNGPPEWIFEQIYIENLTKKREIKIRYTPSLWMEKQKIELEIFTFDGSYYDSQTFKLEKLKGLEMLICMIIDKITSLLPFSI